MTKRLSPGQKAPHFSLPDAAGNTVSLSDYAGQKVIIYFYPQAATPGCTTQACDFRDNNTLLLQQGYHILGISPDKPAALEKFTTKQSLNFPLLSDSDHTVAGKYAVWGEKKNYGRTYIGLIRSTFVLDEKGEIVLAQYNVRSKGHVARLLADLNISA